MSSHGFKILVEVKCFTRAFFGDTSHLWRCARFFCHSMIQSHLTTAVYKQVQQGLLDIAVVFPCIKSSISVKTKSPQQKNILSNSRRAITQSLKTNVTYIIFSKNPSSLADVAWRPKHRFLAKLWHKNDFFDENVAQRRPDFNNER